jgi:hypothetical protein
MNTFLSIVLRLFVVAAGLVFAASLAVVFAALVAFWLLRAGWARLSGRPVMPFVMRVDPRGGFDRMYRRAGEPGRTPRASAAGRAVADVTDVVPK